MALAAMGTGREEARRERWSPLRAALLATVAVLALAPPAAAESPPVMPSGGKVVAGSATITSPSPGELRITQTTDRAAIDWQGFSVGQGGHVQFQQPGPASVALNRVRGPDASVIAGRISANGQVAIVNQSGIVFTPTARVDVGSLVASAAGIGNENFMAGRMVFDQPPRAGARVVNEGRITVAEGGLAALVAPEAANRGVIEARLGRVVIGGAETYAIDLYGDGLLSLELRRPDVVAGAAAGAVAASNTGVIAAEGGAVLITARAAGQLVQSLVEAGGTIAAKEGGRVAVAAPGGVGRVTGMIETRSASGRGGEITVTGREVTVAPTARLDASGAAGGGRVRVGGDLRGGGAVARAEHTTIAPGATLAADATVAGDGGSIVVWADQGSFVHGRLTARGGPLGGDGGLVETSGLRALSLADASIDTSAPRGSTGTWLIDPFDLTIGTETSGGTFENGVFVPSPGVSGASLDVSVLAAALGVNNVTLSTAGDGTGGGTITLAQPVVWSNTNTLTLDAVGWIVINAPVTAPQGRLVLTAVGLIAQAAGAPITVASLQASAPQGITLTDPGNAIPLVTALGGGSMGPVSLVTGVPLTLPNGASVGGDLSLTAPSLTTSAALSAGSGRTLSLTTDTMTLGGDVAAPGGVIAIAPFTSGRGIALGGAGAGGPSLDLTDAMLAHFTTGSGTLLVETAGSGPITIAAPLTIAPPLAATLDLRAGGPVTQAAALSTTRLAASGSSVTLTDPQNVIGALGTSGTTAGAFSLAASAPGGGALVIEGPLSGSAAVALTNPTGGLDIRAPVAGTAMSLIASGGVTQTAGGRITASSLALTASGPGSPIALALAPNEVPVLAGVTIGAGGGSFGFRTTTALAIDGAVTVPGAATLTAGGGIGQTAGITATSLSLTAGGDITIDHPANGFGVLAGADAAGGAITVVSAAGLTVTGPVSGSAVSLEAPAGPLVTGAAAAVTATSGAVTLTGTAMTLGAPVSGAGGVTITAAGSIISGAIASSAGAVSVEGTGVMTGEITAAGDITVTASAASTLGGAAAGGDLDIDAPAITASGALVAGAGRTLSLTTDSLSASDAIAANGGTIRIGPRTPGTPITLGANGPGLALPQSVLGHIDAGSGRVEIGDATAGAITIAGTTDLTGRASRLSLASGGAITQSGRLVVPRLAAAAGGPIGLGHGANTIGVIDGATAAGAVVIASTSALAIEGAVQGTGVTLFSAGGGIHFAAPVDAGPGTLSVTADGAVTQTGAGAVTAARLTGTASSLSLTAAANALDALGPFSVTGTDLALATTGPLTLSGTISAQGILSLQAGGAIAAEPGMVISAARLSGSASGGTDLGSSGHAVAAFGGWSDPAGGFAMRTAGPLVIEGDVALGGPLSLRVAGALTQGGGSTVTAAGLSGWSIGGMTLTAPANAIASLGPWLDPVSGITLETTGPLALAGTIDLAGTLALAATEAITQAGGGAIIAPRVTAAAPDGIALDAALDAIDAFGAMSATGGDVRLATTRPGFLDGAVTAGGSFSIAAGGTIVQTAPITASRLDASASGGITLIDAANAILSLGDVTEAGGGAIRLATTTGLAIDGHVTTSAMLALSPGGDVTQGPGGAIEAAVLTGASTGGMTLDRPANRVQELAGWANAGGGGVALVTGTGLAVTAPVDAGAGALVLNAQGGSVTLAADLTAAGAQGISVTAGTTLTAGKHHYTAPAIEFRALAASPAMTLDETVFTASERVVLAARGSMRLDGTMRVLPLTAGDRPAIVISIRNGSEPTDVSRVRPDLAGLGDAAQFTQIESFPLPTGLAANALTLGGGGVLAPASPLFLLLDRGSATGTINVARLGLVIFGGSTDLSGCVAGVCGPNAASLGRSTDPSSLARLNNCPVSSPNCLGFPTTVSVRNTEPPDLPLIIAERQSIEIDLPLTDVSDEDQ